MAHAYEPPVVVVVGMVVVVKVKSDRLTITHLGAFVPNPGREGGSQAGSERTNAHEHTRIARMVVGKSYVIILGVREAAPQANRAKKGANKKARMRRLLESPTQTASQPPNSIGGDHRPRSVASTRQAARRCDGTPPRPHQPPRSLSDGLSPYTTSRHTRAGQSAVWPCATAHGSSHSQLTTVEPRLVESVDTSAIVTTV